MPTASTRIVAAVALAVAVTAAILPAQQSLAILDAPVVTLPDDSAPFQELLDWDGDGDLDAVGVRARSDGTDFMVQVWRNDAGAFTEVYRQTFPAASATVAPLAVDDVDGDGRADFLVGTGPVLHTFRSLGNGQFARTQQVFTGVITALRVADIDRDGLRDRVLLRRATTTSNISSLEVVWGGGGSVVQAQLLNVDGLLAMEYDGDPQLEVAVTQWAGTAFWYDADRNGLTYLHAISRTITGQFPVNWLQGDVDGDGDIDLLSFGYFAGGRCEIWRRTGPATYVHEPPFWCDALQQLVDLDGDGDLDGLGSTGYKNRDFYYGNPYQQMLNVSSSFCIGWNDGSGRFTTGSWPGHGNWSFAGAVDLDGDGDLDLVAGGAVHYGRGSWLAVPMTSTGLPYLPHWRLLDLDRDGDLDIAASLYVALWNDGAGVFTVAPRPGVERPPNQGFTGEWIEGDFDGDGAPDLITGQGPVQSGSPVFAQMMLLQNNGGGRWRHAGGAAPLAVRMGDALTPDQDRSADWDGDGDLDLAIRSGYWSLGRTDLWRNDGGGRFTPLGGFAQETLLDFADVDGDGRLDCVATATTGAQALLVRLGTGNAAQPFGVAMVVGPTAMYGALVGDLDDDGRPDVVVIDASGVVSVLTNVTTTPGVPLFATALIDGPALDPGARLAIADLDGDGRSDLIGGPLRANNYLTAVWRRIGGNGPLGATDFAPRVLAAQAGRIGDVDGDGDLDLVGSWFVRNRRVDGPLAPAQQQYGNGVAGEGLAVPVLGLGGPLRVGRMGQIVLNGIAGPGVAAFALAGAAATVPGVPLPGHVALVDPNGAMVTPVVVIGSSGERGAAQAVLGLVPPAAVAGLDFFLQGFALDPRAPSGVSASQGLRVRVGG